MGNGTRTGSGKRRRDHLVALFLATCVAFSPPMLRIFGLPETVFGLPLLALYLFTVWLAAIGLTALAIEGKRAGRRGASDGDRGR